MKIKIYKYYGFMSYFWNLTDCGYWPGRACSEHYFFTKRGAIRDANKYIKKVNQQQRPTLVNTIEVENNKSGQAYTPTPTEKIYP